MQKSNNFLACLIVLFSFVAIFSFPKQILYFTTNTLRSGTSVEPGFQFNHIWSSVGTGGNGHIYTAISNTLRSHGGNIQPNAEGNVCVAAYNPYNNTMRSVGTVKKACQAVNNWIANESQEKIHTPLQAMPDGKIWMATHDNYEMGHYHRGSHLLYVDVDDGDTLVDYSKIHKYNYHRESPFPTLNLVHLPGTDTTSISIEWHSIMIIGLNPHNTRYLWTHSIPNGYHQVWDIIADTTRTIGLASGGMREMAVGKDGSLHYGSGSTAYKKTVHGRAIPIGSGLPGTGSTMTYSHSYDSAFTMPRGTGEVMLFDMINDTVKVLGNMPDAGTSNKAYRAVTISADGKKLYVLGASSNIYEFTIATGSYRVVDNASSQLSGYGYAISRSVVDTLGNWYIGIFPSGTNGAALLKISMGKSLVKPLPIPPESPSVQDFPEPVDIKAPVLAASPNPFSKATKIRLALPVKESNSGLENQRVCMFNAQGKLVDVIKLHGQVLWQPESLPEGVYIARVAYKNRVLTKRLVLLK